MKSFKISLLFAMRALKLLCCY